jgi:SAM-dependent methyltransferase
MLGRHGLSPFVSISSEPISLSSARSKLEGPHLLVSNVSGFYHRILQEYWERFGLGLNCLLVSETTKVAAEFRQRYPNTTFTATDYYVELQPEPHCDVVWDLCAAQTHPALGQYDSIVCQATLEHVLDPIQALRNLAALLNPGGHILVQTHTPAFHYHAYPRDYLRYFPDWFADAGSIVGLDLVELLCVDGHAFAVYGQER